MKIPTECEPIRKYPKYSITKEGKVWSSYTNRWLKSRKIDGHPMYLVKEKKHRKSAYVTTFWLLLLAYECGASLREMKLIA